MSDVWFGLGVLVLVFFLTILLGLQIQITGISRRLDEIIDRLERR